MKQVEGEKRERDSTGGEYMHTPHAEIHTSPSFSLGFPL